MFDLTQIFYNGSRLLYAVSKMQRDTIFIIVPYGTFSNVECLALLRLALPAKKSRTHDAEHSQNLALA